jgi:hypothetical protein
MFGDFTYPPFEKHITLQYHKITNLFYSRYFIDNNIGPGMYKLKFVVDGECLCDGNLPINQDMYGNFNNLISIKSEDSPTTYEKKLYLDDEHSSDQLNSDTFASFETEPYSPQSSSSVHIMRARSSGDMVAGSIIQFMAPTSPAGNIVLNSCAYMIAHPHSKHDLKSDGSADVYFINESKNAFGLADGVGEWEQHGINPRFFPEELIFHC